jgi:hypothetical protein
VGKDVLTLTLTDFRVDEAGAFARKGIEDPMTLYEAKRDDP